MSRFRVFVSLLIVGLMVGVVLAGKFLIVEDAIGAAGAIVVIGGDHKPERMQRALDLYQQGYAPVVIISAGTLVLEGNEILPEAEVMRRQIITLGLSENAIVMENRSQSTYENARFTKQILEDQGIESILLVTSAYHSRRARRIFDDVSGNDITVAIQPAQPINNPMLWLFYSDEADVVRYEYRNWMLYWLATVGA